MNMKILLSVLLGAAMFLATVAGALSSPYYAIYGYNYAAGGYAPYNGHPYSYGPSGWGYSYSDSFLYPVYYPTYDYHSSNWYHPAYYSHSSYYYRGYGAPWYYNYWPYSYRVYNQYYS